MGWVRFFEIGCYDFVDGGKVFQICYVDVEFYDVFQFIIGCFIDCFEVFEYLMCFGSEIFGYYFYGFWYQWNLIGQVYGVVGFDCL